MRLLVMNVVDVLQRGDLGLDEGPEEREDHGKRRLVVVVREAQSGHHACGDAGVVVRLDLRQQSPHPVPERLAGQGPDVRLDGGRQNDGPLGPFAGDVGLDREGVQVDLGAVLGRHEVRLPAHLAGRRAGDDAEMIHPSPRPVSRGGRRRDAGAARRPGEAAPFPFGQVEGVAPLRLLAGPPA